MLELPDGDEMVYRFATGTTQSLIGLRLKLDGSLSGLCVQQGEILRCDDSEFDARVDREACRRAGARSMVVVPLRYRGETVAVLKVLSASPRFFNEADVGLLEKMAGIIATAVGRAPIAEQTDPRAAFVTALNHEIRTPLTSVRGFAALLRDRGQELPEERRRALTAELATSAETLDRLIVSLLEEKEGLPNTLRRSTFDVGSFVMKILASVDLQGRPVTIQAPSFDANLDQEMLRRIIVNLVDNVLRHTPPATPMWVGVSEQDDAVLLQVDDAGPGIPEALRESIFAPFNQVSMSAHSPGLGLGLSIVARLAAAHDGRAWVEERDGGGSSFKVALRG